MCESEPILSPAANALGVLAARRIETANATFFSVTPFPQMASCPACCKYQNI
jgi:hypothetical protein